MIEISFGTACVGCKMKNKRCCSVNYILSKNVISSGNSIIHRWISMLLAAFVGQCRARQHQVWATRVLQVSRGSMKHRMSRWLLMALQTGHVVCNVIIDRRGAIYG